MSRISLFDCTLRDGGYINNWNFGKRTIRGVCRNLIEAHIDVVEVGFMTNAKHSREDALYYNCIEIERAADFDKKEVEVAAMIAIGEKEVNPQSLPNAEETVLDIVRITFHHTEEEIKKAVEYARCLMEKGYKVCMQPIGTTVYKDKDLLELIELVNQLKPYAFYLVDTLGTLYKRELMRFIYLIDNNLNKGIKLGFHSHNNLQMSFSNAQMLLEYATDREFLIDCSIFGMGRGAGNLCTELIAQYMNTAGITNYNMMPIIEAIDNYINPIYQSKRWGYSAPYYMAAIHNCHPDYASYLMNKQTLNMNQIELILKQIKLDDRHIFKKNVIEDAYFSFQKKEIDDTKGITYLKKQILNEEKTVLILASGKTLLEHRETIVAFMNRENPLVISINGSYDGYQSDYIFLSNQKRMKEIDYSVYDGKLIMTSNLPRIKSGCIYVDYDKLLDCNYDEADNAGLMLLRLLERVGIRKIYIAGFDGFEVIASNNYYSRELINGVASEAVKVKNEAIREQLKVIMKTINIVFLTPSKYITGEIAESVERINV